VGNQVRVKVVKNKVAPPFKKAEFDILYGEGISKEGDLIDLGVTANVIQKSKAWYSFGEERLGQGRDNVRTFLKENPDLYETIKLLVFKHFGIGHFDDDVAATADVAKPEAARLEAGKVEAGKPAGRAAAATTGSGS